MKNTREHDKKWIETLQERNRVLNELLQLTQIENEELKEQLTLTDVVKPFYCLDEVHRGKKDRCKQQCEYCTGFS